jgi:hypothetical protein
MHEEKDTHGGAHTTQRNSELGRALIARLERRIGDGETRKPNSNTPAIKSKIKQNRKNECITQDVKIEIFH